MAFSGIRSQVLGNCDASNDLKLADLPDLMIGSDNKSIIFAHAPAMIVVRDTLGKTKNKYFAFLPSEDCVYVLGYVIKRI